MKSMGENEGGGGGTEQKGETLLLVGLSVQRLRFVPTICLNLFVNSLDANDSKCCSFAKGCV